MAKLVIAVFAIALTLFFAEIIVRSVKLFPDYDYPKGFFQKDDLLGYSMTPNFKAKFTKQEFSIDIETNSLGLRDVEYGQKKGNDFRILALGDSFTWGAYGVELEDTFIKVLEKNLNSLGGFDYQVINSGVPGYGLDQEYLYLINRGYKLKPDLLLINFCVCNDFLYEIQFSKMTVKDGYLVFENLETTFLEELRAFFIFHSHLYRVVEKGLISIFGDFIERSIKGKIQREEYQRELFLVNSTPKMTDQIERTKLFLDQIDDFAKASDISLAVSIIPLPAQVDDKLKKDFSKRYYPAQDTIDFELPQKIIKEWGNKNNVLVIDLLPELKRKNKHNNFFWKYNSHFNLEGNITVGQILYNNLIKNVNLLTKNILI